MRSLRLVIAIGCAGVAIGCAGVALAVPVTAQAAPVDPGLAGQDWTSLPTHRKVVALTFDAGANADGIPAILATLKAEGIPATFFLTGTWAKAYPAYAREIADRGYVLGNHTTTHPHVPTLSDRALAHEIRSTEHTVRTITGRSTKPYFRFPFGDRRDVDVARVNVLGYAAIAWTVDTAGWLGTSGGMSVSEVLHRVETARRPGEIVLMHVGSNPTDHSTLDADALPRMIAQFRAHGYGFTTLAALR